MTIAEIGILTSITVGIATIIGLLVKSIRANEKRFNRMYTDISNLILKQKHMEEDICDIKSVPDKFHELELQLKDRKLEIALMKQAVDEMKQFGVKLETMFLNFTKEVKNEINQVKRDVKDDLKQTK